MKRVLIIGCCGAGKSTLARKLSERTGLELIHLDQYHWKADWAETHKAEWEAIVDRLIRRPAWIMDGNFAGTLDRRLRRADAVIFLDYPTMTCLYRITKRVLRYYGRTRPDMTEGCRERFDLDFYRYVATFNRRRRPAILRRLAAAPEYTRVVVLSSDADVDRFLQSV